VRVRSGLQGALPFIREGDEIVVRYPRQSYIDLVAVEYRWRRRAARPVRCCQRQPRLRPRCDAGVSPRATPTKSSQPTWSR